MATPTKPPKTMSSRLLTMKFMQRAAATPDKDDGPPAKKSRLSNGSAVAASPASSSPRTTAQAVQEALAVEEQKRLEALEREGANKGETKWYLSVRQPDVKPVTAPLQIVSAGYSTLDSGVGDELGADEGDEEEEDGDAVQRRSYGRRNFGKFRKVTEQHDEHDGSSDSSDGDEESDEDGRTRPNRKEADVDALIAQGQRDAAERARAERRTKKGRDNARSRDPSDDRRRKHVNLNRVSAVSSGGGSPLRHSNKRPHQRRRE